MGRQLKIGRTASHRLPSSHHSYRGTKRPTRLSQRCHGSGGLWTATEAGSIPASMLLFDPYDQGWNFDSFLVLLGFRRLYSLSGKYSPSIPFPIEPEIPGTQSTRLRPQFHTESLIGKPKILHRQTHGITTKAYRSV